MWLLYVTEGREGDPGALDRDADIFWVDAGDPPSADIPEAITPEILAQLAYAETRVPLEKSGRQQAHHAL